ncbi:hypothetical protein FRC01_000995 [Tulasnella sp. 417]|nr:hypothetical protein FRC01_000995 [Tulasnella sp. 417]
MSDATFDFTRYLASTLSIQSEDFNVHLLPGGFTNLTARAMFKRAIQLPSSFEYPNPVTSLILKMGTSFMRMEPSCAVPISRQAVEARALRMLQGKDLALSGIEKALEQSSSLNFPKFIYHDTERQVLWMTDLGESKLFSDHILSNSPPRAEIEELGVVLGRFFANLFMATRNPTTETVDSLSDSRHLLGFLTAEAERVLVQSAKEESLEANSLMERMQKALDQQSNLEPCLGTELGMFVGHFHFLVLNDESSNEAIVTTKAFISSFASEYFKMSPDTSDHFERKFLIAYGRSLIGGTNLFARAYQSEAKAKAIHAGIICLEAAGDEGGVVDHKLLDRLPLELLSGLPEFVFMPAAEQTAQYTQYPSNGDASEADLEGDYSDDYAEEITPDLEEVLSGNLDFGGDFYFAKTYDASQAPNPFLQLDRLGAIGSPLSTNEAKRVIRQCVHAPFGQGERTIVDTSVRDTWEMDAKKVGFGNPQWSTFVANVVKEACAGLGVDYDVCKPRCEIYKLLVYETGSHFLPHQDTEKVDGMFATLIILLPSKHTGGAAHLSHSGRSAVIDSANTSEMSTSVMAWYTDVVHEIKPINSGYRFALSYNLIRRPGRPKPTIKPLDPMLVKLVDVMKYWHRNVHQTPRMILYLLQHKYSQANLRQGALKGRDAHQVAILQAVAERFGIRVSLAIVECHIAGQAEDYSYSDDWETARPSGLPIGYVDTQEMKVTMVSDLDGTLLLDELELDEDGDDESYQSIPENLRHIVERGRPDAEEYEGYQGNYGGNLERWYRRTMVVMWPCIRDDELLEDSDLDESAIQILNGATSTGPSIAEKQAARYVLRRAEEGNINEDEAFESLRDAAIAWKDVNLWDAAFDCAKPEATLDDIGVDQLGEAIHCLGPSVVLGRLQGLIDDGMRNVEILDLLAELQVQTAGQAVPEVQRFIEENRHEALEDLDSLSHREVPLLVSVLSKQGGIVFFEESILPRIGGANIYTILALAKALQREASQGYGRRCFLKRQPEVEVARRVISFLRDVAQ